MSELIGMTGERYDELDQSVAGVINESELALGWHWCLEFDGLLIGPGWGELRCCTCLPPEHPVYKTIPPEDTGIIDCELL